MNRRMQKKKDKKITEAINGLVFIAERREQQRQAAIQQFVKRCEALYGGKDMMYRTELLEEITIENATVKINAKIEEMEKESYRLVTMSFWGTERAVLVFKKGLKGSLL